jgi:O-methyltransferase
MGGGGPKRGAPEEGVTLSLSRARKPRHAAVAFQRKSPAKEVHEMPSISKAVRSLIKDTSMRTGVYDKTFFEVYPYCFEPKQLIFLTECVRSVANVSGSFLECGCLYGATTVFLNKFMDDEGFGPRRYYAIDTFSGFTFEDADHEVKKRGKSAAMYDMFRENKKEWYDKTISMHGIKRVTSVQNDIMKVDFAALGPVAFCLLDVDLYVSTKDTLPKIYNAMAPGGIIIVDDCKDGTYYDGAAQAYGEFVNERGMAHEIVEHKLGVIRVPRSA